MYSGSPSGARLHLLPFHGWLNLAGLSFLGVGSLLLSSCGWVVFFLKLRWWLSDLPLHLCHSLLSEPAQPKHILTTVLEIFLNHSLPPLKADSSGHCLDSLQASSSKKQTPRTAIFPSLSLGISHSKIIKPKPKWLKFSRIVVFQVLAQSYQKMILQ